MLACYCCPSCLRTNLNKHNSPSSLKIGALQILVWIKDHVRDLRSIRRDCEQASGEGKGRRGEKTFTYEAVSQVSRLRVPRQERPVYFPSTLVWHASTCRPCSNAEATHVVSGMRRPRFSRLGEGLGGNWRRSLAICICNTKHPVLGSLCLLQ